MTTLLYPERVNAIFGESESGKSWLALLALIQVVNHERHCIYIDYEDSPKGLLSRLRAMGLDDDQIIEFVTLIRPQRAMNPAAGRYLANIIRDRSTRLVVIDSMGEAMGAEGYKQNDDDAIVAWVNKVPRPIAQMGPAVLLIDHVPKDKEAPRNYQIGGQRKRAMISGASYRVDVIEQFARGVAGRSAITVAKDREGHFVTGVKIAEMTVTPGDFPDTVTVALIKPNDVVLDDNGRQIDFKPTYYMERVSRTLHLNRSMSKTAIRAEVGGKRAHVDKAIQCLIDDGYAAVEGSGPKTVVVHVRAYDETEALIVGYPGPSGSATQSDGGKAGLTLPPEYPPSVGGGQRGGVGSGVPNDSKLLPRPYPAPSDPLALIDPPAERLF